MHRKTIITVFYASALIFLFVWVIIYVSVLNCFLTDHCVQNELFLRNYIILHCMYVILHCLKRLCLLCLVLGGRRIIAVGLAKQLAQTTDILSRNVPLSLSSFRKNGYSFGAHVMSPEDEKHAYWGRGAELLSTSCPWMYQETDTANRLLDKLLFCMHSRKWCLQSKGCDSQQRCKIPW